MASSYNNKYKLLMQLDTCVDTDIPKAERIRSKLMQVNASKDNTNSAHIEAIKTDLTKQLFAITDSNESTDKIGAAVEQLLSNSGRQRVHRNEWKCALNDMTHEQMAQTFKLDRKVTNKCDKLVIPCNTEDFVKCNDKSDFEIIDISSQSTSDGNQSQPVVDNGSDSENSLLIKLNRFHNLSKGNQNSVNKSTDKCTLIEDKTVKKSQTKRKICSSPSGLFKKQTVGDSPHQTPNKNKTVETDETESSAPLSPQFITGREKQIVDRLRKSGDIVEARKSLTASRQFIPPKIKQKYDNENNNVSLLSQSLLNDERLKNIDPKMIELINNEIIESKKTDWNDIAGLEYVKKKLKEILVLPLIRPDLFTGIRTPPKGLLLFGPPGTGKTLIGRCVASQSNSTFFSITASSLTSKWVGVGEKMVKAMFAVSKVKQPSVIFIDEIDSLLTQRCDSEHESSRRLKTEFLAQFDGVNTSSDDRVLIIGATNRPQELDEAARRRFTSRIYIPLPDINARKQIIENCMKEEKHSLTEEEMVLLAQRTDGYSGADMFNLCRESAMESYRDDSLLFDNIDKIEKNEIRAINYNDFVTNLDIIRPSVCDTDLQVYQMFNNKFGTNLQKK